MRAALEGGGLYDQSVRPLALKSRADAAGASASFVLVVLRTDAQSHGKKDIERKWHGRSKCFMDKVKFNAQQYDKLDFSLVVGRLAVCSGSAGARLSVCAGRYSRASDITLIKFIAFERSITVSCSVAFMGSWLLQNRILQKDACRVCTSIWMHYYLHSLQNTEGVELSGSFRPR